VSSDGKLSGWGRISVPGEEIRSEDLEELTKGAVLTRGLGRSYGDASLPPPSVTRIPASPMADRVLSFDETGGLMRAEAGLSLEEISRVYRPRCWSSPVLTGTQYVTLGGMVAADVHGKEHHEAGCFGEYVQRLKLRLADDRIVECSREEHADLFAATIGGMGLTGHILEVEFAMQRIASPWIWQQVRRIAGVDDFLSALAGANEGWPFIAGWIDCLKTGPRMGRGILYCGRWATKEEAPAAAPPDKRRWTVPVEFPQFALNRTFIKIFNAMNYGKQRALTEGIVHPESFFHPLDVISDWNKIYGRRGFTQYQCVLPKSAGPDAPRKFLERLTGLGASCFLGVIKNCGPEGFGMLSFPMEGTSLALDIPVRADTQRIVDALNEHLIDVGGRVYLAKDVFTRPEHFRAMESRLDAFQEVRSRWDPERRLRSAQSVRLMGDRP
jgi:FAD/FMN-containing dehydrogenase